MTSLESTVSNDQQQLRRVESLTDIDFLRECIASGKPTEYYFGPLDGENTFVLAILKNKVDFIGEVFGVLPLETKQKLIQHQNSDLGWNALHYAASVGNIDVVKLFLDVFKCSNTGSGSGLGPGRPWLIQDNEDRTVCHVAIGFAKEECIMELMNMDKEILCNMVDYTGCSLLCRAVAKGLTNVALEILGSDHSFSASGFSNRTPFHLLANCSEGEEVCRQLLRKVPNLLEQRTDSKQSIFHFWAAEHKIWPFECLLKSNDIIPDIRNIFVNLISGIDSDGDNPLHVLACQDVYTEIEDLEIARLLIAIYKQEIQEQLGVFSSTDHETTFAWLMQNKDGKTPLTYAITNKKEEFALYLISVDINTIRSSTQNALLLAITNGCGRVAEVILKIVNKEGWTELLLGEKEVNALQLAPSCTKDFCKLLLELYPELLKRVDIYGNTVLHTWVTMGEVWPIEYILQSPEISHKWRSCFINLTSCHEFQYRRNPFQYAAISNNESAGQIVELLVNAFVYENNRILLELLPWFYKDINMESALHLAMLNHREKLALYILSLRIDRRVDSLLDLYEPVHKTLFLAIQHDCFQVAREILKILDKRSRLKYLIDPSDERTVLHLAATCKDKEFGRWLVEEASELITKKDKNGNSPLDEASNNGAAWLVEAMLQNHDSAFEEVPLAYVKACKKGYTSVVRVFMDYYPGKFSDHCNEYQDSPLHHIKLRSLTGYEEFLQIPHMKDLINIQDINGLTPLHKAIKKKNILLTETLLNMDKIRYNIKDNLENKTAKDMLEQLYKEQPKWKQMCKSIGFDPTIKTTYFENKADLLNVRNTLSLVAALLATITFTAGFTLPGGLDQNTGEAMLAKKAIFLVFLLSDTIAMCCSMLILIFLVWSMVYDPNKSLVLIDRSMKLLLVSLYFTLLAFVTGVYIVISPKSLWAAIVVIFMCSFIALLANMNWISKLRHIIFPQQNDIEDNNNHTALQQLEEGSLGDEEDRLLKAHQESSL